MSRNASQEHRTGRALNRMLAQFWPAPYSALGLALAAAVFAPGGPMRRVDGTLACGVGLRGRCAARLPLHWRSGAITLGHGSIGVDPASLDGPRADKLSRAAAASAETGRHG